MLFWQFPDMSLPAVCGIDPCSVLPVIRYGNRHSAPLFKSSQKGKASRSLIILRISPPFWTCWRIPKERRTIR
ncbi:hypothetical protein KCP76_03275 [Salmonella enterica subsp. enterica serovar Weltevreden]|nr:hypothetical protein KCP76_03275 [Salmonella enterica subsp. enterica serovar Weltevreden]